MDRRAASVLETCGFSGGGGYLFHGLVPVCEIELSHIGANNGYPDLVCQKGWMSNEFCIYAA